MTAVIYTRSKLLWGLCSAYLGLEGYPVKRLQPGEPVTADVVILDQSWGMPAAAGCQLRVVLSSEEMEDVPGCWFYRVPADLDALMDDVLEYLENRKGPTLTRIDR